MKTYVLTFCGARKIAFGIIAVLGLLLGGCLEQSVVWAPDGQRAVVLIEGELRLCGPDGKLSEMQLPNTTSVAWLSDSRRLLLATGREIKEWTPYANELGADGVALVEAKAESVWRKLSDGMAWSKAVEEFNGYDSAPFVVYLREKHGAALRAKVSPEEWTALEGQTNWIYTLSLGRVEDNKIAMGAVLHHGPGRYNDIRLATDGATVAFVAEIPVARENNRHRLFVTSLDTPNPQLVADRVSGGPDWAPDGQSLVYVQASGAPVAKDDLLLGVLTKRNVVDRAGKIAVASEATPLAGIVFDEGTRVRCLRDGRILFNAGEISLPVAAEDFGAQRQQLFAIDPSRQSTLVRLIPRKREAELPKTLYFYEVSPDETQVLIGSYEGDVSVLTLATGALQTYQTDDKDNRGSIQGAPMWRTDGAFTYTRRNPWKDGQKPARTVEVVVRQNGREQVLSESWPDALVNKLFSK
jgi:hypothetical protein